MLGRLINFCLSTLLFYAILAPAAWYGWESAARRLAMCGALALLCMMAVPLMKEWKDAEEEARDAP